MPRVKRERSGAEFRTVAAYQRRGMDSRVCAASLRSLLRPWMTKRWAFPLIAKARGRDIHPSQIANPAGPQKSCPRRQL